MKYYLILFVLLIGVFNSLLSQGVKVAYVDTDRIIAGSTEAAEIARIYELDKQNWYNQINQLKDEIRQMERDFEIDKLTKNEAAKREAQGKIDAKKQKVQQMVEEFFGDGGKAEQRFKDLIEPLTEKIKTIIAKIAETEKYVLVFDISMGTVMYALPTLDLTQQVLDELNKEMQKSAPGKTETQSSGETNGTSGPPKK